VSSELRVRRADTQDAPVIVILPAMGVTARKYDALADALAKTGYSSVIAELRGIGSSSIRATRDTDFGYREMVEIDVPLVLKTSAELFPEQTPIIFGHSLGGQLACLHLARAPLTNNRIILCASCAIDFRGWSFPANLSILVFTQISALISRAFGYFPGHKLGFGGRAGRRVIIDWARNARSGKYVLEQSSFDYEAHLKTVEGKILTINFEHDKFAPLAATRNLINKLGKNTVEQRQLSALELGTKTADHFSFLGYPDAVAATINRWLRSNKSSSAE
jgi:predicted alpha/beta hydrolase